MHCRFWLALAIVFGLSTNGSGQDALLDLAQKQTRKPTAESSSGSPPPLTKYMGREIAATMHYTGAPWLIRESRQREEDCATMLAELRIQPGMTAVDMGCGNGFYSLPIAELVGAHGRVLAVDIQPEMLRLLEARAKDAKVENIRTIQGTLVDPQLPEEAVDLIICVDVYHEFSHPEQMLAAMRKSLKPTGQLVLAEFREEDPAVPIKPLHKMSKAQVRAELNANGFREVRDFDGLPWQHLMFFARDDTPVNATANVADRVTDDSSTANQEASTNTQPLE
jgi:ubiquinone/menaquinone biosynthesis C-methylase UbiE